MTSKTAVAGLVRISRPLHPRIPRTSLPRSQRASLHASPSLQIVKPFILSDVGEGIDQVLLCQWFVQPGARVAQFDPICEVQSDKASVEITSRFDGVIKKLHFDVDDVVKTGQALIDIDVNEEAAEKLEAEVNESPVQSGEQTPFQSSPTTSSAKEAIEDTSPTKRPMSKNFASNGSLATPAVRHLSKELDINISEITGTGKDGRVLKEDLQNFASSRKSSSSTTAQSVRPIPTQSGEDKVVPLTGIAAHMFKTMTKSLTVPHFLYTDSIDFTQLNELRQRLNSHQNTLDPQKAIKISPLPFIIKAVSMALESFPTLNSHLDASDVNKPKLTHKAAHNIGVAIDTPSGLIVPVIRNVQSHSISSIATEIKRLSELARTNKLAPSDLSGATFTISNIGSIGGGAVAPVIVCPQVAILGVGRARAIPAFGSEGELVRREEAVFSWSADHRVCDGAMVARAGELVKSYLEHIERMVAGLR
ncbi:hypothetical protein BT63DRAFT_456937 [Microthyrium microscopicum]|uniref:Dihydrolipoamide acetyltransferase component of pyruvate dehydrogenase complex n=1 Tax=Microthyrium microscopicum TaxID=703497 RepID=A0A6A6U880_9PEZI|nr:hypothetical protein BT63DRAFT_456937 [Microthyrium microscopicum]